MSITTDVDYTVGQRVNSIAPSQRLYGSQGYGSVRVETGDVLVISRVLTNKVLGRLEDPTKEQGAFYIEKDHIFPVDGPAPRKLGEAPEGDHIPIDDPRIAWIWEDAARVADKHDYCRYYDTLADELGAPGRLRKYTVKTKLAGLELRTSIEAHSRREAEALVSAKLGGVSEAEGDQKITFADLDS